MRIYDASAVFRARGFIRARGAEVYTRREGATELPRVDMRRIKEATEGWKADEMRIHEIKCPCLLLPSCGLKFYLWGRVKYCKLLYVHGNFLYTS